MTAALVAAVFASVHHAEVVALRVGEPFGTLIFALAVTVIEASLIVVLMLSGGGTASSLARDTVFATVMIICNGVVGLCLLVGALRHRVLAFNVEGTTPALAALGTLVVLTLVLPSYTTTTPGPKLSPSQLVFAGGVSAALYAVYVFVQTVRHREYFLPVGVDAAESHPPSPAGFATGAALVLLMVSLAAVVGLAKSLAPASLGSALATIGLTIPVVAAASLALDMPLDLGLPMKETALLVLTLFISAMTLAQGRATVLQGAVHLVLFAVFLFLAVVP